MTSLDVAPSQASTNAAIRGALERAYQQIKGEPLTFGDEVRLEDVEFDSLDMLDAAVLIERDLGVRLDLTSLAEVTTFGDLIATLEALAETTGNDG